MFTINKQPGKDFTILNITDPQLSGGEWNEGELSLNILKYTMDKLIEKVKPDLITVSGDISWGHEAIAYENFAKFMHSYGIPWAPVWGNHDNEAAAGRLDEFADIFTAYSTCIFESGDPSLGHGNYLIAVKEGEKIVEALFMMDTHSDNDIYVLDRNCVMQKYGSYASLTPVQLEWYKGQVKELEALGCTESTLVVHIPLHGYRKAFYAATEEDLRAPKSVSIEDSYKGVGWKDEYKQTSFGVNREGIASSNYDDGALEVLEECGHTKYVIAGHEHANNFSILYNGIRVTYGTKLGRGCYWDPDLNGGTVLKVDENGVKELYHEYVDVQHLL